uniref:Uncharacterized protein n=1 Tax=Arundo donax TaxID=35708 RepID=A0A0A9A6Q4_ARUDO
MNVNRGKLLMAHALTVCSSQEITQMYV